MKIAALTHVRNECDIVEAFVRHTLAFVDRLYIVDNASSDSTPEILHRLAAEGLPVVVGHDPDASFYQSRKTTSLLRQAMADAPWDFVLPLDGDEFIRAPDRTALERSLSSPSVRQPAFFGVQHYAPTRYDAFWRIDAPRRIRHRLEQLPLTPPGEGKIVVPGDLGRFPSIVLGEGNHALMLAGRNLVGSPLPDVHLAHFPIRSVDQFVSRAVVVHLAWISRADFSSDWVRHIQQVFRQLKRGKTFTAADLLAAAHVYARHRNGRIRLVRDPIVPMYGRLRYRELIKIDLMPRVLAAAERVADQLREARAGQG